MATVDYLKEIQDKSTIVYILKTYIYEVLRPQFPELSEEFTLEEIEIYRTVDAQFGDFTSNIALKLSRILKKAPQEIAKTLLAEILKAHKDEFNGEKCNVAGPGFLNFALSQNYYKSAINTALIDPHYGTNLLTEKYNWVIEHTSPNPNKAMHLGHLRNNLTGMAVANLLETIGVNIKRECIDNNRGIAIAKLMWGYLQYAKPDSISTEATLQDWYANPSAWKSPESEGINPGKFVDELYVKGSEACKNAPEIEEKVRQIVVDWEAKDPATWALWQKVLDYSYAGQQITLSRLGNKWDKVWHEHEHYQMGKDLVEEGLKKGIFKLDEGAVITQLEDYNLPNTVVIKSDGTSLYITQDIALTKLKKEYHHADKLFWVIGPEQSLALSQMFAVCEQLGIGKYEDFIHLPYGYMLIKGQGKMSSRKGNVIYIDDLIDQAKAKLEANFSELKSESKDQVDFENLALAAIKFSILKVGRTIDVAFDVEESVSFEGFSGPYVMYSYVRANAILNKSEQQIQSISNEKYVFNELELDLAKHLSQYPLVLLDAARNLQLNLICNYLFELAQLFNKFYKENPILNAPTALEKETRLALVKVTKETIAKGLQILGINPIERM